MAVRSNSLEVLGIYAGIAIDAAMRHYCSAA